MIRCHWRWPIVSSTTFLSTTPKSRSWTTAAWSPSRRANTTTTSSRATNSHFAPVPPMPPTKWSGRTRDTTAHRFFSSTTTTSTTTTTNTTITPPPTTTTPTTTPPPTTTTSPPTPPPPPPSSTAFVTFPYHSNHPHWTVQSPTFTHGLPVTFSLPLSATIAQVYVFIRGVWMGWDVDDVECDLTRCLPVSRSPCLPVSLPLHATPSP